MKHLLALKEIIPSLRGKTFAITGTTSGTGFVAAQVVAEKGGKVLLLNRSSERATESLERLKAAVPDGEFVPVECDLQDFSSVKAAAQMVKGMIDELYCFAGNAGVMALPNKATKDGYDVQMQTNHLSHFILAAELWPLLVKSAEAHGDARVVTHSSIARNAVPGKKLEAKYLEKNGPQLGDDSLKMMSFSGDQLTRYHHSKLANSLFTQALHAKITASESAAVQKIRSCSAHPGVANTGLATHLEGEGNFISRAFFRSVLKLMGNTVEDAACGLLTSMTTTDAKGGFLYGPKNDKMAGAAIPISPAEHEIHEESLSCLWTKSQEATGLEFRV